MGMLSQARLKPILQALAQTAHLGKQILFGDDFLYLERRGAGDGMAEIGVPCWKNPVPARIAS